MIEIPLEVNDSSTEQLINGMLLILKYQPDATYDFVNEFDYFRFGSLDRYMTDDDKWQLLKWNWREDEENNCWSHL